MILRGWRWERGTVRGIAVEGSTRESCADAGEFLDCDGGYGSFTYDRTIELQKHTQLYISACITGKTKIRL